MSRLLRAALLVSLLLSSPAWAGARKELRMNMDEVFTVAETDEWQVEVQRELPLRFADVLLTSKKGAYPFSMMLYFKCDSPDLAKFDSPEKIFRSVRVSSEKYLAGSVEKQVDLKPVPLKSTYGYYVVFTDAKLAGKSAMPEGEFKYLTRGMVRLSKNSALGFSLMTNDLDSAGYRKLTDYIYGFVGNGKPEAQVAVAATPVAASKPAPVAPAPASPTAAPVPATADVAPAVPAKAVRRPGPRAGQDARECLKFADNAKVRACAENFR